MAHLDKTHIPGVANPYSLRLLTITLGNGLVLWCLATQYFSFIVAVSFNME
jgi:hypothetical protein